LFHSVAETLHEFASDPQHGLEGQRGFTAGLHPWDQKLWYHVQLPGVIAGGARAFDGSAWRPARRHYLFSVQALSRVVRSKYLAGVERAFANGELVFPGRLAAWATPEKFPQGLSRCRHKDWVVDSQPPFTGPAKVLEYLSRYTHRVAISNQRLRAITNGPVTFAYRDRRAGNAQKPLPLPAHEFIRRFLLQVVPPGFCRIRQYGFLGNRVKQERRPQCRALLGQRTPTAAEGPSTAVALLRRFTGMDVTNCPRCPQGTMVVVERLPGPPRPGRRRVPTPAPTNSS
jgi:hypothetical protein